MLMPAPPALPLNNDRERERKGGTLARLRLNPDLAAVHFNDALRSPITGWDPTLSSRQYRAALGLNIHPGLLSDVIGWRDVTEESTAADKPAVDTATDETAADKTGSDKNAGDASAQDP
jgi:hypothetical protein